MKKLLAMLLASFMIAAICAIPAVAADRVEVAGYYEYASDKNDEVLAGEAGEASIKWDVPYLGFEPVLDGTIGKTEYERFENYEDYITLATTTNYGADAADALYQKVKDGFFDVYWGWDGKYLYMAFEIDCVDGYHCNFNDDVMLFAYNCLQIGLDEVDCYDKTSTYTELGFGYDNVTGEDRSFTWAGTYQSGADDFTGKYDDATKRVTYEVRIDLQLALGLEAYPENGDQCNMAFVLEISGENDSSKNAQVLFCQGIGGQYSMKKPQYFARITFTGKPDDVVIPPSALPNIDPIKVQEYDLREFVDMSDEVVYNSMTAVGGTIEKITEGDTTFLRFTATEDGGYFYSNIYPRNVLSDARYAVIKYRATTENAEELGVLWKTRQDPEFRLEECFYEIINVGDGWNYYVIDTSSEGSWQDYIRSIGFMPFHDATGAAGSVFDLAWIEFYGEDPYDLYEDLIVEAEKNTTEADTEPEGDTTVVDGDVTTAPEGGEEATTAPEQTKSACKGAVGAGVLAIVAILGTAIVLKKD